MCENIFLTHWKRSSFLVMSAASTSQQFFELFISNQDCSTNDLGDVI